MPAIESFVAADCVAGAVQVLSLGALLGIACDRSDWSVLAPGPGDIFPYVALGPGGYVVHFVNTTDDGPDIDVTSGTGRRTARARKQTRGLALVQDFA